MSDSQVRSAAENWIYSSLADEPDFEELLQFFVSEIPEKQTVFSDLAGRGDIDNLQKEAHKLKGSAGGYGFQGLSVLASQLEESCKFTTRDSAEILRIVDELLDYLARVRV